MPKFIKTRKAPVSKIKPTTTPNIKEKIPLKKKKRIPVFVLAALLLVVIGSTMAILLLPTQKKEIPKETAQKAPSYYFSKEEGISSITEIVGERDFERQTALEDGIEKQYSYLHAENPSADLKSYMDYLESEKNFIDVTEKSHQDERTPNQEAAEIHQLAGPSKDSAAYLSIALKSNTDSYTLTIRKENQPWNTYYKDQWNQQKKIVEDLKKQPKAANTIEQAEDTVRSQGPEKLGLPGTADSYEYIGAPGVSKIEGTNYYTVRAYKRQPDKTLIYAASYLLDYSTNKVAYQYDEVTGKATPLK